MSVDAPDLFANKPAQGDLFAGLEEPRPDWEVKVDPEMIRLRLRQLLAQARATEEGLPWPYEKTRMWRVVFPQMANWLPHEEAEQLRAEFRAELERLGALAP